MKCLVHGLAPTWQTPTLFYTVLVSLPGAGFWLYCFLLVWLTASYLTSQSLSSLWILRTVLQKDEIFMLALSSARQGLRLWACQSTAIWVSFPIPLAYTRHMYTCSLRPARKWGATSGQQTSPAAAQCQRAPGAALCVGIKAGSASSSCVISYSCTLLCDTPWGPSGLS